MNRKRCSKCKKQKPLFEFYKRKYSTGSYCNLKLSMIEDENFLEGALKYLEKYDADQ